MSVLVLATRNKGKIEEVQRLISQHAPHIQLRSVAEFDLEDVEETGTTFEENAVLKAATIARQTGLPALADDSGIAIDALGEHQVFIQHDGQVFTVTMEQISQKFSLRWKMSQTQSAERNLFVSSLLRFPTVAI